MSDCGELIIHRKDGTIDIRQWQHECNIGELKTANIVKIDWRQGVKENIKALFQSRKTLYTIGDSKNILAPIPNIYFPIENYSSKHFHYELAIPPLNDFVVRSEKIALLVSLAKVTYKECSSYEGEGYLMQITNVGEKIINERDGYYGMQLMLDKEKKIVPSFFEQSIQDIIEVKKYGIDVFGLLNMISMMNCKNVILKSVSKIKNQIKLLKNRIKPKYDHHVVMIKDHEYSNYEQSKTTGIKCREHLCRGHFKQRKTGVYWWSPHWRGNQNIGAITKDYEVAV